MKVTAVLGCGVIGSSWVAAFVDARHRVQAWDPEPHARTVLKRDFGALVEVFDTPGAAVCNADFVQENGPELLTTKRLLLQEVSGYVGAHTVVATSTSTLQPSQLQADLDFADRLLVGHPFNPPHILPLVEVVGGVATSRWAIDEAMKFYAALGKHPIELHRERPGHLANRLQAALWREAVDAVASGQASVEDVDAAVTLALGPRWALNGPFATFHLGGGEGGLQHFIDHLGPAFEALWDDAQRPLMTVQLQRQLVSAIATRFAGRSLRDVTTERDTRLRAILALTQQLFPESGNG